jgi:hypothetical protein
MKRNRWIPLFCVVMLLLASLACIFTPSVNIGNGVKGSGNVKTETRPVSGFQRVVMSGVGDVQIAQGQEESLEIEAEDNILAIIETKVTGDTLILGFKEGSRNVQPTRPIKYRLTVKDLVGLQTSGAGNIETSDLKTSDLDVQISGAGNIKIDSFEASSLAVLVSGAGNCEVSGGKADKLKLEISGAGSFHSPDLQLGTADLTISGLGSARLWVTDFLDVMLSGTGSVEYYGQPKLTQLVTGLGTVKSLGEHP